MQYQLIYSLIANTQCWRHVILSQGDHLPSFNTLALDTGDSSLYSSSKKDDESVDRLLGSLSPIPDGSSELSSMDHFSIVTSQAVSSLLSLSYVLL